jgi:signal transduction histidine kinase/ligand-binding sensor domain-containing protein
MPAHAADALFKRIGVDDGLPNATIYGVAQDVEGFIWLSSTNSGLLRYDGYQFTEFQVLTPEELNTLGSQDVGSLLIDNQHNIWAGTWGYGLSRIDAKTGKLRRFVTDPSDPDSLASMQVQVLFEDKQQNLWVGSTRGINRMTADGQWQRLQLSDRQLAHNRIWSLSQTQDNTLWIGTSAGLHAWREDTGLSEVMLPFPDGTGRDNEIRALYSAGDKLWVGTRQGLFVLEPKQRTFQKIPFFAGRNAPIINVISADQNGMLLLGTYNGLFRVHPQLQQFLKFREQQSLLPTVNIRSVFLDRTGVLWLGSRENGLYYTRHSKSAFASLHDLAPQLDAAQLQFTVTAVFADKDAIWLGSAENLYRFDRSSGTLKPFLTDGRVNAIRPDQTGQIFAATDVGLYRVDQAADQVVLVTEPFRQNPQVAANIRDLSIQADGSFWIGLWGDGVIHWNPAANTSTTYLQPEIRHKTGDAVQAMLVSGDDTWVGTRYSGVFRIRHENGQVEHFSEAAANKLTLPSQDVQCLEHGPAATLLICTQQGLVVYDPQTDTQHLLDERSGLPTSNIIGAYADQQQNIWLLSAKGLSLKHSDSQRLITFTRQDGLVATEQVFKSFFDDQQGSFYIGSIEGLTLMEPALIWINQIEPKVAVSRILVNNKPLPMQANTARWPDIVLKPTDTSLEFEFASLDFHDPTRNQYMYKLTGFDQDWILQPGRRGAYYSNLPAGDYELELKGSNNHGLFNQVPERVRVQVLPSWWQHSSVQALGFVLTMLLILTFHQYRLRHIHQINKLLQNSVQERAKAQLILETKVTERTRALEESSMTLSLRTRQLEKSLTEIAKANKELKRLDKLKDEFISTVSHELRTPLTSIRGAIGLVAQSVVPLGSDAYRQLVDTAQQNCERLSQLINDLLDVQKFEAGKFVLQLKPLDLFELCQSAVHGIQSYALRYQVQVETQLLQQPPVMVQADQLRLRQVLDNLLSNAVKFSPPDSTVILRLSQQNDMVLVEVIDQGQGIPDQFKPRIFEKFSQADASDSRSKEGTGLGLTICKRIIESHGGQIGFSSTEHVGTQFWIRLARLYAEPEV